MTPRQYIDGRRFAAEGLGREDILVRLKISDDDARTIIRDHARRIPCEAIVEFKWRSKRHEQQAN